MVATLDSTGARRETIRYSTYGLPFGIASGDVDGSGSVVAGDATAVNAQIGKSFGVSGYTVLLDVDLDGDVDVNDYNVSNGQSGLTLGHSTLSAAPTTADGGNRMGYAGYAWEPVSSKYAVRHRVFDPLRGRWSRRDPLGYVDGPTLYAYVGGAAMTEIDPTGTTCSGPCSGTINSNPTITSSVPQNLGGCSVAERAICDIWAAQIADLEAKDEASKDNITQACGWGCKCDKSTSSSSTATVAFCLPCPLSAPLPPPGTPISGCTYFVCYDVDITTTQYSGDCVSYFADSGPRPSGQPKYRPAPIIVELRP